ncbi:hypothetical protein CEW91_09585 [Idiomarina piscisalsi]|uniref:Cell wall-active antibiotics response LiaF-like C-terminal domain-containing protein n=1 Tax=Idiomarina piscisalsi TaxID=1096243 RepID=A0ABM6LUV6_9GAMM|nr:DUF1707 domain-containing protein [Idiomarina piscisalsi]ASG66369.1 hypothetical protein CEW91_09585 [Idiomarina piscisalsi]
MSVKFEDRPLDKVREETIDQLVMNYGHGELSSEAFERRLDAAMDATEHSQLAALVEDLELKPDTSYDSMKEQKFSPHYGEGRAQPTENVVSILSSNERTGVWTVPREITVYDFLGSVELDFTDAVFQHPDVTIKVVGMLSSLEIYVPEEIMISTNVFNILGSTENKAPSMGNLKQVPHIRIEGFHVLGSVEVKVKRTIKEKFVAFANSLKETFNSKNFY